MMDELGEEEQEDPDDGINFNHPSHASQALNDPHAKDEESSDDEEDNIVSKTIKQKQEAAQRKQPLEQLDSQINSKSANKMADENLAPARHALGAGRGAVEGETVRSRGGEVPPHG